MTAIASDWIGSGSPGSWRPQIDPTMVGDERFAALIRHSLQPRLVPARQHDIRAASRKVARESRADPRRRARDPGGPARIVHEIPPESSRLTDS